MALKLIKVEPKDSSWMTTITPKTETIIVEKPSLGFIKYVESKAQSPEMRTILLNSPSEKERYKTIAHSKRHVLTSEEMKRGQEALARGNFGTKSGMTQRQEHIEEEKEKQRELLQPKESKYSSIKYKTIKSKQNEGISYPTAKKLLSKEQYKRIETPKKQFPIVDPIFGIPIYNKPKHIPKTQSEQIKDFARDNFTLNKPKPTERLMKPVQKAEPVRIVKIEQKHIPIVRDVSTRSLFGGMFETPKAKVVVPERKQKQIKRKKPVEKKFKIIKKYYRRYPKHCKR